MLPVTFINVFFHVERTKKSDNGTHLLLRFTSRENRICPAEESEKPERLIMTKKLRKHWYGIHKVERFDDGEKPPCIFVVQVIINNCLDPWFSTGGLHKVLSFL